MPPRSTSLPRPKLLLLIALPLVLAGALALRACGEERSGEALPVGGRADEAHPSADMSGATVIELLPQLETSARIEEAASQPASTRPVATTEHIVRGIVVDERGEPVEGALVHFEAAGKSAAESTDESGRFEFGLPQLAKFELRIESHEHLVRDPGTYAFEEGSNDVRIVLRTRPSTTFVVRDSDTGMPITRFGISVRYDHLSPYNTQRSYGGRLEPRDHPNGRAVRRASEGHHLVRCDAPGFAPFASVVRHDSPGSGVQTIALRRGARIVGRVARDRVQRVLLTPQPYFDARGVPRSQDDIEWEWMWGYRSDVPLHFGVSRVVVSSEHGEFAIEDLFPGTYRLMFTKPDKSLVMLEQIAVAASATEDLGFVDLDSTGALVGTLRAGRFQSHELVLELDQQARRHAGQSPIEFAPGPGGRFEFDDLTVGTHRLGVSLRGRHGSPVRPLLVTIAAGETTHVEWNIEDLVPRRTCVRVTRSGAAVEGLRLVAARWESRYDLGLTDAAGLMCWDLQPSYENLLAISVGGMPLGLLDFAVVDASADVEQAMALECGSVLLRLDDRLQYDDGSAIQLHLQRDDWPILRCDVAIPRPVHGPTREFEPVLDPERRTLRIPQLAAGRWNLTASLQQPISAYQSHGYIALAELVVVEGRETVCELLFH